MVRRLVCFGVCVLAVCASAAVTHRVEAESANDVEDSWWPNKQISMVQRMLNDCSDPFTVCLKARALTFLDRVTRKDNIQVMEGLSLVADEKSASARAGRALTEEELQATLPRDLTKKEETLDQLIVSKISDFFSSHSLKLDLAEEGSDDAGAARKKEKKLMPYLMLGKLVAAGHLALALKGLALLALKALFISKIALVLAGVIALKKLFSHGGGHKYEVITSDHHEGHDRVYAPEGYAQDLAYRQYPNKQQ